MRLACASIKLGCVWPLEPVGVREFAQGLDLIIVVEEKRSLIEMQLRELLYGSREPADVIGKKDENGGWLFPASGALDANDDRHRDRAAARARAIPASKLEQRLKALDEAQAMLGGEAFAARIALFLFRLPAQQLDESAGRHARLRRHRLPLHGAVDGPRHRRLHADGRRGRELGRRGAVLETPARLPESRRRHL